MRETSSLFFTIKPTQLRISFVFVGYGFVRRDNRSFYVCNLNGNIEAINGKNKRLSRTCLNGMLLNGCLYLIKTLQSQQ